MLISGLNRLMGELNNFRIMINVLINALVIVVDVMQALIG